MAQAQEHASAVSSESQIAIKIIDAMSVEEREKPDILLSRAFKAKQRIAEASGTTAQDINRVVSCVVNWLYRQLDQFQVTQAVMMKMHQYKKQNKPLPEDMAGLLSMIQTSGGLPKNVTEILKRKQQGAH